MEYKEFLGKKVVLKLKGGTIIGILETLLGHFKDRKKKKFIVESLAINEGSCFSWSIPKEAVEEIKLYDDRV